MRRGVAAALTAALTAGAWAAAAPAQLPAGPLPSGAGPIVTGAASPHGPTTAGPREVVGRVERITRHGATGVGGLMVTLHRVGPDRQGPVDSSRTTGAGDYRFRYAAGGSDHAIFFASASWAGIAYVTPPLAGARATGDAARIMVYDTASRGVPLHVRGRHVIVSATDSGDTRTVIEVFELANDSVRTIVGRDTTAPTWTAVLPIEAQGAAMGPGDVSADAAALDTGRLRVYAPFAPGIKQLSFSYQLPRRAFPLTIPAGEPITVLEVLVEDSRGVVVGAGLQEVNPVSESGRIFRRFLAQDVPAGAVMTIGAPASPSAVGRVPAYGIAIVVGVVLLAGLAGAAWRDRRIGLLARRDGDA